jgi:hypothetical protein
VTPSTGGGNCAKATLKNRKSSCKKYKNEIMIMEKNKRLGGQAGEQREGEACWTFIIPRR